LEFELAYLDYLKHAGFAYEVPAAIATTKGSLFATVQGHYWLYGFIEGRVVESLDQSHLEQLAQMMARLHTLIVRSNLQNGQLSSDPYNRAATLKEIEEYRAEILRKKNTDEQERTFLDESAKLTKILRGFNAGTYSHLGRYPIHQDLISENLIWDKGKLAGVIDFEHVSGGNDPVVKDIAVTMQYCCRSGRIRHQLDIAPAARFLRSYLESHRLSNEEVELIPDLITAGYGDDFVFAFWMTRNDPKRAKQSEEGG